jgi:hypothetical protein
MVGDHKAVRHIVVIITEDQSKPTFIWGELKTNINNIDQVKMSTAAFYHKMDH